MNYCFLLTHRYMTHSPITGDRPISINISSISIAQNGTQTNNLSKS